LPYLPQLLRSADRARCPSDRSTKMQRALLTSSRVAASAARVAPAVAPVSGSRAASSKASSVVYNFVFKRNVTYISYIVAGAIVLETVYGKTLDGLFNTMNSGVCLSPLCIRATRWRWCGHL